MPFVFQNDSLGGNKSQIKTIDDGIIGKLSENGYNVVAVGITPTQLTEQSQPVKAQLMPGGFVPVYQTSAGGRYVVNEKMNVFQVTTKQTDPTFDSGGGQITQPGPIRPEGDVGVMGPPLIFEPPMQPPTGGGTPLPTGPGGMMGSGRIFTRFEVGDIVPNQQKTVTKAMWSSNVGNLLSHHTSSLQTTTQKRYYYEIYNSASNSQDCVVEPQYSVQYGHKLGSGSADEGGQIEDTPSRGIYGQYRLLCLGGETDRFVIGGQATNHIYVVNINRARFREQIDEGNIELNLHYLSGSQFITGGGNANAHTGSNVKLGTATALRLIDDSKINSATVGVSGERYNIVSGTIEQGVYNSSNPHVYGHLYPRLGVAILDANRLDMSASFATVTGSEVPGDNAYKLFTAISGAAAHLVDGSGDRLGFAARSSEKIKSTHYFIRVKNGEYNFSNNPTFVTGSEGDLADPSFIGDPQVYITTVGMYNARREMVAVAKLSKPLLKNFTREALIRACLNY